MGTHSIVVRDIGWAFGSHQAPLVRTADWFQTEQNSCPVLQLLFGFQPNDEFWTENYSPICYTINQILSI